VGTYQPLKKFPWEMKMLKIKKGPNLMDVIIQDEATDENKAEPEKIIQSFRFLN
jgi:hypothetical protein